MTQGASMSPANQVSADTRWLGTYTCSESNASLSTLLLGLKWATEVEEMTD